MEVFWIFAHKYNNDISSIFILKKRKMEDMKIMSTCYELTLTGNYVMDWDFNMAIRELIQNGMDQEVMNPQNEFTLEYDNAGQKLRFINKRSKLKINTLLLGRSSKTNNEDTIGKFGEGYKIAALVLNRLGKTFTIYNNEVNEIWISRFKNSKKWLEKILAFYVYEYKSDDTDLIIEVGNVTDSEYRGLDEFWIGRNDSISRVHTEYGDILTDEEYKGSIYVNGLYIECHGDFQYGYDLKPKYVELERDRKSCDSWNVKKITSKMLPSAMLKGEVPFETIKTFIEKDSDDINYLEFQCDDNNKKSLVEKMEEAFEEENKFSVLPAVPVYTEQEKLKVQLWGGNPVVVPYRVSNILSSYRKQKMTELEENYKPTQKTPKEELQIWYDIYKNSLSKDAIKHLTKIINML